VEKTKRRRSDLAFMRIFISGKCTSRDWDDQPIQRISAPVSKVDSGLTNTSSDDEFSAIKIIP
jgi:hypothetical protein